MQEEKWEKQAEERKREEEEKKREEEVRREEEERRKEEERRRQEEERGWCRPSLAGTRGCAREVDLKDVKKLIELLEAD
eukprot:269412-Hanusia_phi.AAC.1